MDFPKHLWYTREHEWISAKSGLAMVGVSAYAIDQLGDVVHVDLNEKEGNVIKKGEPFGSIESTKTVSDLYAPVNGKIVAINKDLLNSPEKIQDDPYEKSWLVKIEVTGSVEDLLDSSGYQDYLKED